MRKCVFVFFFFFPSSPFLSLASLSPLLPPFFDFSTCFPSPFHALPVFPSHFLSFCSLLFPVSSISPSFPSPHFLLLLSPISSSFSTSSFPLSPFPSCLTPPSFSLSLLSRFPTYFSQTATHFSTRSLRPSPFASPLLLPFS